jgi:predicted phage terminase large subunit-like protein
MSFTHASVITMDERIKYRSLIESNAILIRSVEQHISGKDLLSPRMGDILFAMSGTEDIDGQLRAVQYMYEEIDKQYDEQLRHAAQYKFSQFCEYTHRTEIPALHHEFLIDHMERVYDGEILRLAISMPPGAAKSSYASIRFAAWYLGKRPDHRWVQGAHTQTFAKDRLGKPVRGLINEPRYANVFPETRVSQSSSAADYFEFANKKGYYKAVGVGTGIAGYRFEIGGVDDPIASRAEAESPTLRKALHDWFDDDFGTRPSNPLAPIFVANTRWHEDDLVGHELSKMKDGRGDRWTVINIPALAEEDDPLGRAPGEGLWPEIFGTDYYRARKAAIAGRSWNSLYQGNPIDEEGGVLKTSDIKRYKEFPVDATRGGVIIEKKVRRITLSVDCAEKATARSDYTAATIWVYGADNKHYLVHAARTKAEFSDIITFIEELAKAWNVDQILVEDRGAGTQYIQLQATTTTPAPAPVIAIQTMQKSKAFRFDGVTPMFVTGQALLPYKAEWIPDVEKELLSFPGGKNDDYVDSVSQYLSHTRANSGRRGVAKVASRHG